MNESTHESMNGISRVLDKAEIIESEQTFKKNQGLLSIQDAVRSYISDLYTRANLQKILEKSVKSNTECTVSGLESFNSQMAQKREESESKTPKPEFLELRTVGENGELLTETVKLLDHEVEGWVKEDRLQDEE